MRLNQLYKSKVNIWLQESWLATITIDLQKKLRDN